MSAVRFDLRARTAHKKATYALLVDHFKLSVEQIAKLTDRQIAELYFHRRTKEGAIKMPEGTPDADEVRPSDGGTLENDLRDLVVVAGLLKMKPEAVEAARANIKAKYARERKTDGVS